MSYLSLMENEEYTYEGPTCGCLVFPAIFLLVGIAAIAAGFFFPDFTTFNTRTGQRNALAVSGPIVGGVFIGVSILFFALWSFIEIVAWRSSKAD